MLKKVLKILLDQLSLHQSAEVVQILDHPLKIRLMALGFKPGVKVSLFQVFGTNQTFVVQLSSQLIAVRREEAQLIEVTPL